MLLRELEPHRVLMGRLERGDDLLGALTDVCRQQDICLGTLSAIGAVEQATLAYYDQLGQTYQELQLDRPLELLNLHGNISQRDGACILHLHATFADEQGNAFGGHISPGTSVFACEFSIHAYRGEPLHRGQDPETGLPLWVF